MNKPTPFANTMGNLSIAFGLVGLICCGIFLSPLGIVCGVIAVSYGSSKGYWGVALNSTLLVVSLIWMYLILGSL